MTRSEWNKRIGRRVKVLRSERLLTQADIAEWLGIAVVRVGEVERGVRSLHAQEAWELARRLCRGSISEVLAP